MKAVRFSIALALAALAAAPAYANFGGGSKSDEPQKPPPQGISSMSYTPRQEAEKLYADGREEVMKAKKDLEEGKTKNAEKKFKKALDKGERAVEIDPKYHEAWNLVGYSSRKLKNYDHALVAYDKCLALKPDYTLAREYLGEAYLEMGNLPKAREQLAWLQGNAAASQDAKDLGKAVADYEHAHGGAAPDSMGAHPDTTRSAPADTSRSGSGW
jgi:tetratricopeptide (TPR) repeat protein